MTMVVFLGPTLPSAEVRAFGDDFVVMPPAAFGDVFRVARERPFAIGVVDGYFEHKPAVWHKEILWALSHGVHVFGAASMGALRAAELANFGMCGVGSIYEAYRSGELTDDDEVAVAHADGEADYRASSEALVNMRATLSEAVDAGVVTPELRSELVGLAKARFYPERSYPQMFDDAERAQGERTEFAALRNFVRTRSVDVKRRDALNMLSKMRELAERNGAPPSTQFEFSRTEAWCQVELWCSRQPRQEALDAWIAPELIAAEVRRLGAVGASMVASAVVRAVGASLVSESLYSTARVGDTFHRALGQVTARHIATEARGSLYWETVVSRAQDKQRVLEKLGLEAATPQDLQLPNGYVVEWYLGQIDSTLPHESDISFEQLLELGLTDRSELEREAAREYIYAKHE